MMVDQFVVVYSSEIVCVETSTTDEDQVSDLLAFFRVVRAMKNLPWKTIGIGIGIILLTLQQVDPGLILRVLDLHLHPVEQAE